MLWLITIRLKLKYNTVPIVDSLRIEYTEYFNRMYQKMRKTYMYNRTIDRIWNYYFHLQEFGDSARARKLYEQDSDDDNDEELEINIKLEQGTHKYIILA